MECLYILKLKKLNAFYFSYLVIIKGFPKEKGCGFMARQLPIECYGFPQQCQKFFKEKNFFKRFISVTRFALVWMQVMGG